MQNSNKNKVHFLQVATISKHIRPSLHDITTTPHHTSHYITPHLTLHHTTPHHTTPRHTGSHHTTPHHTASHPTAPHHTTPRHFATPYTPRTSPYTHHTIQNFQQK
eukprot:Pompholyxophrys_punicea_v1_NODE_48_length_4459_cov_6.480699.p3 type:complete len:106 gc:universal NODE_48_length_4459_cov_6.480699:1106-1423(+)